MCSKKRRTSTSKPTDRKDLVKELRGAGCYVLENRNGKHEAWLCPDGSRCFIPRNNKMNHGLAHTILKQANLV